MILKNGVEFDILTNFEPFRCSRTLFKKYKVENWAKIFVRPGFKLRPIFDKFLFRRKNYQKVKFDLFFI